MGEGAPRVSRNPLSRSNPLAPVYLCVFLFAAGEGMLHLLVPPYLGVELGQRPSVVGLSLAAFAVAALAARLPIGALYTIKRARMLLVLGGSLSAVAFVLVALAPGPLAFTAFMAMDGIGWSISTTAQLAVLVAARPPEIGTASAMGWYSGFNGLGNAVAGIGGFIGDSLGYRASFLVLAAIPAVATAVMVVAMPWGKIAGGRLHAEERPRLREAWRSLGVMPMAVWAGTLVMIYINLVNGVVNGFHALLALGAGLSLTQVGILAGCRSWGSSGVRLGSGMIFSRTDGRWMTTPLVLLGAATLFVLPWVRSSFVLQVPIFLAMGLSRGLLRVTGTIEAFDGIDDARLHGMVSALIFAGLDIGKLLGPIVGGVTAELVGLATMFQVVAVAVVVVYLPLDLLARRSMSRRTRAE